MKLDHLLFFSEIARQGSLTSAAETLYCSHQSLSRMIQLLEEELSVKLFNRSNKGLSLTVYGNILLDFVERFFSEYKVLQNTIKLMQQSDSGIIASNTKLVIQSVPTANFSILPPIIEKIQKSEPTIEITIGEKHTFGICEYISQMKPDDNTIFLGLCNFLFHGDQPDFSLVPQNVLKDIVFHPLKFGSYYAFVSKNSSLSKRKSISIHELLQEPIIMYAPNGQPEPLTYSLLTQYGTPSIVFLANNIGIMSQYISMNLGVGALILYNDHTAIHKNKLDELVRLPLEENCQTVLCLLHHKTLDVSKPFIQTLLNLFQYT